MLPRCVASVQGLLGCIASGVALERDDVLVQGKLREWEKGLPSRVSEPPAVLAQNAKGVVALLVEDLCPGSDVND